MSYNGVVAPLPVSAHAPIPGFFMIADYDQLSRARTVDDIIHVTRTYLSSWSPEELNALPEDCRPSRVLGPQDIEHWADRLLAASQRALLLDDERRLDRLTSHFLIASVKLRQVGAARMAA